MMHIDVLSLFPDMFAGPFEHSMVGRARRAGLVDIAVHQLRDWAADRHRTVDDYAYGGGKGMLLKPEPIFAAVESLRRPGQPVILMDASGEPFSQRLAADLARNEAIFLLCGHYEGIDERVREHLIDRELSIGDYVLTGGELPAMVVIDAVTRLVPGVLAEGSAEDESFAGVGGWGFGVGGRSADVAPFAVTPALTVPEGRRSVDTFANPQPPTPNPLLEYPQFTRPVEFRGWRVPEVLLSGDHARIARWRQEQALLRTRQRRPDLLRPPGEAEAAP